MKEREIIFKTFYWSFEDVEEDDTSRLIFHVSGMTKNQETVQIQIENFKPHVYLQLPHRVNWDKYKCKKVFDYFKNTMKKNAPVDYKLRKKDIFLHKKEALFIYLNFSTSKACKDFVYKCSQKLFINGVGMFQPGEFLVHEHNIDPILKFTTSKKIQLANWILVKETIHDDESDLSIEDRKFSTADIDMYVDYQDVEPYIMNEVVILKPLYCSFDIECYSTNHNSKLPDPDEPENKVFQISMYFGRFNDESYHKSYLLSLFNPFEIEDSTLIKFKTEKELLLYFSKLIRKKDPLFFEGYNIMKFDWTYMIKRAKFLGIQPNFLNISRLIGKKAELCKVNWNSSAYGEQEFLYPDCHGRTQLDVILEVERNFKLPIYSLNAVAERFLDEHKDDISPRQLFMFYKITQDIYPLVKEDANLKELQKQIKSILPFRKTHGIVRKHRRKMLNCSDYSELKNLIRECLTMTLKYCKQDTILPVKLVDKLKLLTTMEEMSNVMHIPMSYLHTRGQQIKVLAQVYRETFHSNIVIPFNKKNPNKKKENYEGTIVAEAIAGDYNNVGTLDFFSLYPCVMIAFNICHTTLVDDKNIPDEECNVLEWTSHVGCPHDPLKRKKKKNNQDIMVCGDFKCRFKKVVTKYDENTKMFVRENEGVLPKMLRNLLMSRSDVKKEMFKEEARLKLNRGTYSEEEMEIYKQCKFEIIEKGSLSDQEDKELETKVNVLNAKQLAIKVSANSTYGSLGADQGYIPLISGAASVTAMGRRLITMATEKIRKEWKNCKVVYGDSVTGGTPIMIRDENKLIHIIPIEDVDKLLLKDKFWKEYPLFKLDNENRLDKKRINVDNLEVWTNGKWSKIKKIIKHKVNKKIYRVQTGNGVVDVTEDHSLLRENGKVLKPKDAKIKDKLLCSFPSFFENNYKIEVREDTEEKISCSCCKIKKNTVEFHKGVKKCKKCRYNAKIKGFKNYVSEHEYHMEKMVTTDEAWVWGFFMADGSCGKYDCKHGVKYSWALNNKNLLYLEEAKNKLESVEPYEFKILDTIKSSGVYKLVPVGRLKFITEKYRKLMYYDKKKIVPSIILNGDESIRKSFFNGYYIGDGYKKNKDEYSEFTAKNQLSCQHLFYLAKSIGYNNLYIKEHSKKDDIYCVRICKTNKPRNDIRKIRVIHEQYEDYVYDIETEEGKFHAGLGEIILKNTDSCMIIFEGCDMKETFDKCIEASKVVTHYLKSWILGMDEHYTIKTKNKDLLPLNKINSKHKDFANLDLEYKIKILDYEFIPVDLSFETLYERFLLLTKKRYIAYPVNKDGKRMGVTKKGVVLTRRDNSQFVRIVYKKITDGIMDRKEEQSVMYELYDEVHKLFTRQVPEENLIIYVGVKKLIEYAKKKKFDVGNKQVDFYIDKDGDPIDDVVGPLDPRLVYTNIPQVILSLKLLKRGTDIPPNTRLEHIYLENKDAIHKGEKADDYTYYKENKDVEGFKPDYLLYLDSLQAPITELLNVKYPKRDIILYEKIEDAIKRVLSDDFTKNIGEYKICLLARTTKYTKSEYLCVKNVVLESEKVGWDALKGVKYISKMKIPRNKWEEFINKQIIKNNDSNKVYNYKGILAKIEYILESEKRGGINDFSKNNKTEKEIIDVCDMYKNRDLLTRIHSYYHIKKRPYKKPTQTGEKLIKGTKIYILKGEYKGEFGHITDFKEIITEGKQTKKHYTFNISIDETKEVLENVPRDYITSYFYRDDSIMKDIYTARLHYKNVVDSLKEFFNPIKICD